MFKRSVVTAIAMVAIAGAAQASDLPSRNAPPVFAPPLPVFTWTGFYVGANAGYSFSNKGNTTTTGTPAFQALGAAIVPSSLSTKGDGFTGGGQIGYNYQYASYVFGLEGDVEYIGQKKTASFTGTGTVLGSTLTTTATKKLEVLGTIRGRLGYTPIDRLLVFATGGLAIGDVKTSGSVVANAAPGLAWSGSKSDTKIGYALGAGIEYAVTNNVTIRGEYLYYNLGKQNVSATGNANVLATPALNGVAYNSKSQIEGSLVRAAVNYKF